MTSLEAIVKQLYALQYACIQGVQRLLPFSILSLMPLHQVVNFYLPAPCSKKVLSRGLKERVLSQLELGGCEVLRSEETSLGESQEASFDAILVAEQEVETLLAGQEGLSSLERVLRKGGCLFLYTSPQRLPLLEERGKQLGLSAPTFLPSRSPPAPFPQSSLLILRK